MTIQSMKKIMICCLLFLTSCVQAKELQPVTIVLDWFVNPQHAPIIIAQEHGFFKQHGLEVTIITPSDPSDPPKLVADNKADLGIDYQPELYLQIANGLPIVRVGTLVNVPLRAVATLKSSGIDSLKKFKGKTVGYSLSGVGDAILTTMLKTNGVDPKSVQWVNIHYDLVQALLSKKIDAISGVQRNFEIPELQLAGHPAYAFYPQDNGVPMYDELIFIANKNQVNNPKLLAFMQAIAEAMQYMRQHPDDSWKLLIKHHPELNNKLNKLSWQITRLCFATSPMALDAARYQSFAQWLQKNKLITTVLPVENYAVNLNDNKKGGYH
jgi:putative hydroxymethylpyrimidine transport system substrate-binding protein